MAQENESDNFEWDYVLNYHENHPDEDEQDPESDDEEAEMQKRRRQELLNARNRDENIQCDRPDCDYEDAETIPSNQMIAFPVSDKEHIKKYHGRRLVDIYLTMKFTNMMSIDITFSLS